jgi:SAM-dependent methyltransferase
MLKKTIKKILPVPLLNGLNFVKYCVIDAVDALSGRRNSMIPPTRLMFDGPQDLRSFVSNGAEFLKIFKELTHLSPDDQILDVGSGIGRKTLPLTKFLNAEGRYEGIEIVRDGVEWCKKHITKRYPNFHFQQIDVYNTLYNPTGKHLASAYRFPFDDETFDLVILGSVFTHMLPDDMAHYMSEIRRVMKMDGRCLISYFLLNDDSLKAIGANQSSLSFNHERGIYRIVKPDMPEFAIAYDEMHVRNLYLLNNMKIVGMINFGSWCGRRSCLSYQDLILANKNSEKTN